MKKSTKFLIYSIVFGVFFFDVVFYMLGFNHGVIYVTGRYSTKCYVEGQESKLITDKIIFDDLQDCLDFIKAN